MDIVDLKIDVSDAVGLNEPATIAATVHLPEAGALGDETVVCFGKPGGGYSKAYYTVDLPGPASGAQAEWHAERGWVFVSIDHLGVGESSTHHDGTKLDYTRVAAASQAAEQNILSRLAAGELVAGYPSVQAPLLIGIGQSMGGCLTVIQQGRYHCYDGIGILGYSAVHTHPPVKPGDTPIVAAWLPRDTLLNQPLVTVNAPQLASAQLVTRSPESGPAMAWGFHYSDVDPDLIASDLVGFPTRNGNVPPWGSATLPEAVAASCLTPGTIAPEAAAVRCPVLVGMGERDVIADPKGEPRAYLSANSVDLFICPRMGHMHNFASTRELFWERIERWSAWARAVKHMKLS
jgi:alpha-beta hydrolase superfamily lysophospholipase